MLNFAFAFGQQLAQQAVIVGNSPVRPAYAVWPVALLGGFIPNVAYSVFSCGEARAGTYSNTTAWK